MAGLNIQNSPEFNSAPSISLRGSEPLLVIDGVPYGNVSLKDIAADDIESVDVLKGAQHQPFTEHVEVLGQSW